MPESPQNQRVPKSDPRGVFRQGGLTPRVGLYARVSTHDQQTLGMQVDAMIAYIKDRGWTVTKPIKDIGSGVKERGGRELLLKAARRR